MKTFLTVLFTLAVTTISFSQSYDIPRYFIKFSPLSILDISSGSIQFSLEQQFSKKRAMHYSLGYVYYGNSFLAPVVSPTDENSTYMRGFRGRVEYRMYRNSFNPKEMNFFHGPNLIFKQTSEQRLKTYCTGNCVDIITEDYVLMKNTIGLGYGLGWNMLVNDSAIIEFEMITGLVYRETLELGLPLFHQDLSSVTGSLFGLFSLYNGFLPTAHFVLRIGLPCN